MEILQYGTENLYIREDGKLYFMEKGTLKERAIYKHKTGYMSI